MKPGKKKVVLKPTAKLTRAARTKVLKEGIGKITLPDRKMEVIFIPNRVADASYEYTLFEERTLNYILYALQDAIRLNMNGMNHRQLDLFQTGADSISINIPMNEITSPNQYPQLRQAVIEMGKTEVHIYSQGEKMHRTVYLFRGASTWSSHERSNTIAVEVSHEVADLLIEVEKNRVGKPMQYTSFLLEAANSFTNKYGSRIYKMISGWKEKGNFYITLEEFRKRLALGTRYSRYTDIRKNILLPVQREMESNRERFDCWYDCNEKSFAIREGRNVVALHFTVHTPGSAAMAWRKVEYCKTLLAEHFGMTAAHFAELEPAFSSRFMNPERMVEEIVRLAEYCSENSAKIRDKAAYAKESILRMFAEERRSDGEAGK